MLIDSHCHLHNSEYFPGDPRDYLLRAKNAGVERVVVIGTSHEDSLAAKQFATEHQEAFWTYGVHPESLPGEGESFDTDESLVAIGEVGLDYHYGSDNKKVQWELLESMIELGLKLDLPFSFHVREAFDDFFAILDNFSGKEIRGVVHSFTDNKKNLKKALDRDFYIGVNGMATYSTLPRPPLERVLLETDAPFLAPVPYRGKENQPAYICEIAKWVAEAYGVSVEEVAKITSENVGKIFKI